MYKSVLRPTTLGEFTLGATKSHDQRAVALVQLSEAGSASSVSDDRQLPQDERLCTKT